MKNKIVASELLEERARLNFDQEELKRIMECDPEAVRVREQAVNDIKKDPLLQPTPKFHEMTP